MRRLLPSAGPIHVCLLIPLLAVGAVTVEAASRGATRPVSVSSQGTLGRGNSEAPSVSGDGSLIAFQSAAENLAPGDRNGVTDIFVHDMQSRKTRLVSVSNGGDQANGHSFAPVISVDGRSVAFESTADDLDFRDADQDPDIYVRDLALGATELVSVSLSGGGANGGNRKPAISGDGRYVVFESWASNLVEGDTNGVSDVFVRDRVAGVTLRASVATDGAQASHPSAAAAISGDGRFVAFRTPSPGLVDGDHSLGQDYFIREMSNSVTERISVRPGAPGAFNLGGFGRPALSEDGRFVAFDTEAPLSPQDNDANEDVYVRDRQLDTIERVSAPLSGAVTDHSSLSPSISADGRYVAFYSGASNLVTLPPDYRMHVFVRDRERGATELVSLAANGAREPGDVLGGSISADGRFVAFASERAVPLAATLRAQVYLRTRGAARRQPPPRLGIRGQTAFPVTTVGEERSRELVLRNRGGAALHGNVGELVAPFRVVSGDGYFTLPPNGTHIVTVSFEPTAVGRFTSSLVITVDGNPMTFRALRCKGTARRPGSNPIAARPHSIPR